VKPDYVALSVGACLVVLAVLAVAFCVAAIGSVA